MINLSEFFPAGVELKTPERKALYTDILKVTEHHFANMPGSFAQAFKRLFFLGELEGYGNFDGMEVFYICMSLPEASVEQYVKVQERFEGYGNGRAVYMLRTYLGRSVKRYPLQRERWGLILRSIDKYEQSHPGKDKALGLDYLMLFLNSIFSAVCFKGGAHYSLGVEIFERCNAEFSNAMHFTAGENFSYVRENLNILFEGRAELPDAYLDPWFIEFCQRYFVRRDLNLAFLQFCDEIYQAIPEGQRILWQGDRLFVPSLTQ